MSKSGKIGSKKKKRKVKYFSSIKEKIVKKKKKTKAILKVTVWISLVRSLKMEIKSIVFSSLFVEVKNRSGKQQKGKKRKRKGKTKINLDVNDCNFFFLIT